MAAARKGLAPKIEPEVDTYHVAPIRASVRDAIETVLALLPDSGSVRFRDLALGAGAKLEVIVRFLAVLELYKQGLIDIDQAHSFGEIEIRWTASPDLRSADLAAIDVYDG